MRIHNLLLLVTSICLTGVYGCPGNTGPSSTPGATAPTTTPGTTTPDGMQQSGGTAPVGDMSGTGGGTAGGGGGGGGGDAPGTLTGQRFGQTPGCNEDRPDIPVNRANMTFFVTSTTTNPNGGNLRGIAGADAFCTNAANNGRTWRAYLSTITVNARDRIGTGPWQNARSQRIAENVDQLHNNPPGVNCILTENGDRLVQDAGGRHDVITGSRPDGRRFANMGELQEYFTFPDGSFTYPNPAFDFSCVDYTSPGDVRQGVNNFTNYVIVGHTDWSNANQQTRSASWNSSHVTACDNQTMAQDQGDGRIYCFAID